MTPSRPFLVLLLTLPTIALADYVPYSERYGHVFDNEKEWEESQISLPEYTGLPDNHIELYVNQTHTNRVFIHLPIVLANDGSLRLGMTVRTPNGTDNHSYEGIRCLDHHHKNYAFASNSSHTWQIPRQSAWQHFDSYRAAADPARARLMKIFCEDGRPLTAETATRLLQQQAGKY